MRYRYKFCSIILAILVFGCVVPYPRTENHNRLILAGDVEKVIAGRVEPRDMIQISSRRLLFGLGGGTFESLDKTGEALIIAGRGYVKPTGSETDNPPVSGDEFKTPFLVGLGSDHSRPAEIICLKELTSVEEIYKKLSARYSFFAVAGTGEFEELATTALKTAPIYNEDITAPANRQRYFHPVAAVKETPGIFFGLVETISAVKGNPFYSRRIFYINFANTFAPADIYSHTHIAVTSAGVADCELKDSETLIPAMAAARIVDVRHLLTQSRLRQGVIMVYPLDGAQEYLHMLD